MRHLEERKLINTKALAKLLTGYGEYDIETRFLPTWMVANVKIEAREAIKKDVKILLYKIQFSGNDYLMVEVRDGETRNHLDNIADDIDMISEIDKLLAKIAK